MLNQLIIVHTNKKPSAKMGFLILSALFFAFIWILILEKIHYECPFLKIFHIYCAGCGGTRMIHSILRLDLYQAFRYNPLLFIYLICGLIYLFILIFIYIKKKEIILPSKYSLMIILIILLLYMILRNIETFSFLIPTEV